MYEWLMEKGLGKDDWKFWLTTLGGVFATNSGMHQMLWRLVKHWDSNTCKWSYMNFYLYYKEKYTSFILFFKIKKPLKVKLACFWLGFTSHQHCKGYMTTFKLYWWRKTILDAPPGALFRARSGTWVEPLTFRNSFTAWKIPFEVPAGIKPTTVRGKWF